MGLLGNIASAIKGAVSKVTKKPQLGSPLITQSEANKGAKGTVVTGTSGNPQIGGKPVIPTGNVQTAISSQSQPQPQVAGVPTALGTQGKYKDQYGNRFTTAQEAMSSNQRISNPQGISKVANIGLKPAEFGGNLVTAGLERVTGRQFGRTTSEELAATPTGQALGTATVVTAAALLVAGALEAYTAASAYYGTIGEVASTTAGRQAIASSVPEALGVAPTTQAVGQVAVNTATRSKLMQFFTTRLLGSKVTLGQALAVAGLAAPGKVLADKTSEKHDVLEHIADSEKLAIQLREQGMTEQADQIYRDNVELLDSLNTLSTFIPYLGKNIVFGKVDDAKLALERFTRDYEAQVFSDSQTLKAQAEAEQRIYDEQR